MKINKLYLKLKTEISKRRTLITILSLCFTVLFSIYNRIVGIVKESLWHETISIYYLVLVIVKSIILIYIHKSIDRNKDLVVFRVVKVLLIILNLLLIVPISLMVLNKRLVEMSLILSIAVALYVTIKTTKVIISFVKKRKEEDILLKELKVIDLMDVVVSILTLQNTLISVNSVGFDEGLYYLTIGSSFVGFAINLLLVFMLRSKKRWYMKRIKKILSYIFFYNIVFYYFIVYNINRGGIWKERLILLLYLLHYYFY